VSSPLIDTDHDHEPYQPIRKIIKYCQSHLVQPGPFHELLGRVEHRDLDVAPKLTSQPLGGR
jgi:hypothetical protein